MEALRSDPVCTPDTISSLSCINTHHIEELSKEKEEELLYGAGDDGDEEDALSDDSIRLRLSDDDEDDTVESQDAPKSVPSVEQNCNHDEVETTAGSGEGVEASSVPEKNIMKNDTTGRDINQEEHGSGNVSMGDKVVAHEMNMKTSEKRSMSPVTPTIMPPWPNYESQWRFTNNPHNRSFRSGNHFSYARYRYMIPRGYYRFKSYNYGNRSHNAFLPFERGRGKGSHHFHRSMRGDRQHKKGFKPITPKKHNSFSEHDQNIVSSSDTNISPKIEVDNTVNDVNTNVDKKVEGNAIGTEQTLSNNMDNSILCELLKKNVDVRNSDYVNKEHTKYQNENKVKEEGIEVIPIIDDDDDECTEVTPIEASGCNDSSNETKMNSSINSHDNNKETNQKDESGTHNGDVKSKDFYTSDNSIKMETIVNVDTKYVSVTGEITECIEISDANDEKKDEIIKPASDLHINNSKLNSEANQRVVVGENDAKLVSDNKITAKGEVINEEESSGNEKGDVPVQNSNEENENDDVKTNASTVNDLNSNEGDNNIKKIENNVLCEPITNSERCDKELNISDNSTNYTKTVPEDQPINSNVDLQEQNKTAVQENVKAADKDSLVSNSPSEASQPTEAVESVSDVNNSTSGNTENNSVGLVNNEKDNSGDNEKKVVEAPVTTQKKRRRTKKMMMAAREEAAGEEGIQVRESGRQKRRTAKNAEEIIRKKFLNVDSDVESSDSSEKFVIVNHKMNQDARPLSPPSLKRNFPDSDGASLNGSIKKLKVNSEILFDATKENNSQNIKKLNYVHKFFQRDLKEKLPKLKQEELEELLIQKIVETITMRGEIGRLREQARISERNQEVTRQKCQQLAKQIKDFEMVLSRNAADRRANNDKPAPPIKINRSVGLQVNFVTDHGMQNLRQLQQNSTMKSLNVSNGNNTLNASNTEVNTATSPRRGIKIRSPRRSDAVAGQTAVVSQNHTQSPNVIPTITPAALVVTKPIDTQHTLTLPNQSNVQQILTNSQAQPQQPQQTILLNGKFPNQINRQSTAMNIAKPNANDLIDLTDEEEKSKVAATGVPVVTTTITDQQINLAQKTQQPCFQRVIQTIPGNVAITNQPSIRVVQPASQPTPTALVNNMNAPRLAAYVMQSGVGPARQLLLTPNSTPMRPVTTCTRASFSTLTYKTAGISTVANGTVRVLTTPATSNVEVSKHPAPLPDTRNCKIYPHWKLPPPAPSLKISKVANGIVLSWNMNLSERYADIASYQLYAYQEVAGVPPSTSLWKKVGDVRALPLPMACTLTQFSEGNNYYFAIRAVDTHSRKGQYSTPGNISL